MRNRKRLAIRWPRFRLRTLLIVIAITAVVCGTVGRRALYVRQQEQAVDALLDLQAQVQWEHHSGMLSLLMNAEPSDGEPPAWMTEWLGEDFFGNVIAVSLPYNRQVTDADLRWTGTLKHLRDLNLEVTPLGNDGLTHLRGLQELTSLQLGSTHVSREGLSCLKRSAGLRVLGLAFTPIADEGIATVVDLFPSLERLNLTSTRISDSSIKAIRGCKELAVLNLTDTMLTPHGIEELARITSLRTLVLNNTATNDRCLAALARLPNLEELYLRDTEVSDAGASHLADAPKLRVLQICGTRITDKGLGRLSGILSLRRLDARGLEISDTGLESMKSLPLEILLVQNTRVTREELSEHRLARSQLKSGELLGDYY